jgi:hypothetical protein
MTSTRTLLLGAAAALSLSLSPALAEMLSSPQEMAQTRALNASAQSGTYTSPCTLNGEKAQYRSDASKSSKGECASRHARVKTRRASSYARNYHATTSESGRSYGRMATTRSTAVPSTYNQSSYRYGPNGYSQTDRQTIGSPYAMNNSSGQSVRMNGQYQSNDYGRTTGAYASGSYSGESQMNGQYGQSQGYESRRTYGENQQGRMPYGEEGQVATNQQSYGQSMSGRYSEGGYGNRGSYAEGAYAPQSRINPDDFVSLTTVDAERLSNASVETSSGIIVGRVADVTLARDGTPSIVEIALNDGREVRISGSTLRYNPNERMLLTNLDQRELMTMAGETD